MTVASTVPGKWDAVALWAKARLFVERASGLAHEDPQFAFWSSLALELLARSALSKFHPALNADPRDLNNLLYALGVPIPKQPRSVSAHSVYERLLRVVPQFGQEEKILCEFLSLQRNVELHTGDLPFETLDGSKWIQRYYSTCEVLCSYLGKSLEDYFGDGAAKVARELIDAHRDGMKKVVLDRVSDCRQAFSAKPVEEQETLRELAEVLVRVNEALSAQGETCPVCSARGTLVGDLISEGNPQLVGGEMVVRQNYLAKSFQCHACGLELNSLSEVMEVGIRTQFSAQRSATLHELFEDDLMDAYMNM